MDFVGPVECFQVASAGGGKKVLQASFGSQVFIVASILSHPDGPFAAGLAGAQLEGQGVAFLRGINIHCD